MQLVLDGEDATFETPIPTGRGNCYTCVYEGEMTDEGNGSYSLTLDATTTICSPPQFEADCMLDDAGDQLVCDFDDVATDLVFDLMQ